MFYPFIYNKNHFCKSKLQSRQGLQVQLFLTFYSTQKEKK
jgi:hypothetical protein